MPGTFDDETNSLRTVRCAELVWLFGLYGPSKRILACLDNSYDPTKELTWLHGA